MKKILSQLFEYQSLTQESAAEIMHRIAAGEFNQSQIAAFLTVFMMRPVTVEELAGFRAALLEMCIAVPLEGDRMDVCGTGGDGKNTFNISTITAFVLAEMGVKIAKHGNYGVSSVSGSSTVLEHFGYRFSDKPDEIRRQFDKNGIAFMHAPLFHPALKTVGPIRRELGVRTFFNMLGPLVNPARPTHQLTGVYDLELLRRYHYLLQPTGVKYRVLHTLDGYDEVTLTAPVKICEAQKESLFSPADFGHNSLIMSDLYGGSTAEAAAKTFQKIIAGHGSAAQNAVVSANAGLALSLYFPEKTLENAQAESLETLKSGRVFRLFEKVIKS
jgi:anthranilate phosphoribosyltransferase